MADRPEQRRRAILLRLLDKHSLSYNDAGQLLCRRGLLDSATRRACNRCLPGSAVLRALERRGLVVRFNSSRDQWAIRLFSLSKKGREVALAVRREMVAADEKGGPPSP